MGIKKQSKKITEHLTSNLYINKVSICSGCPLRIYAKQDEKITFGIGNIFGNIIFVLPTYNVDSELKDNSPLKLLQNQYKEITGKELLEENYVTRFIKCDIKSTFDLENHAVKYCYTNLIYEISRIKPKKVVILTRDYEDIVDYVKILFNNNSNIKFYQTYNIGVLYYNNEYKENFIEQLKEIIYDT